MRDVSTYYLRATTTQERLAAVNANHCGCCYAEVLVNGRVYQTNLSSCAVLGYIPGIGAIIGLFRICIATCTFCIAPNWSSLQIMRGILEICGVGLVYLPIDLGCLKCERVSS